MRSDPCPKPSVDRNILCAGVMVLTLSTKLGKKGEIEKSLFFSSLAKSAATTTPVHKKGCHPACHGQGSHAHLGTKAGTAKADSTRADEYTYTDNYIDHCKDNYIDLYFKRYVIEKPLVSKSHTEHFDNRKSVQHEPLNKIQHHRQKQVPL